MDIMKVFSLGKSTRHEVNGHLEAMTYPTGVCFRPKGISPQNMALYVRVPAMVDG